jgi:protein-disulfide isomerase
MNRKLLIISTGTILLGLFAAAVLIYQSKTSGEITSAAHENASLLIRDYSPVKGDPDAKVTIVEFFDPACETCRAFYPFVEQMLEANPGRIRLVLRYTPFHDGSDYVVKVLEAAREQGKYWEVLEAAFASQPAWASHRHPQPEKIWQYLGKTGLDFEQARADMHSSVITGRIRQDMSDARQLKVSKTPSYFVNGQPLLQFGYEELQTLVDGALDSQY